MKKFKNLMLTAAVCLAVAPLLNSCNADMSETYESLPVDNSDFPGTYNLTSFKASDLSGDDYIPVEVDWNGDSQASQDFATESSCYSASSIKFNADHTYVRMYGYYTGSECGTAIREVGVWSREGDVVTISSSDYNGIEEDGVNGDIYSTDFTVSGTTLSGTRENTDYMLGKDYGTGKVDFTYSKAAM